MTFGVLHTPTVNLLSDVISESFLSFFRLSPHSDCFLFHGEGFEFLTTPCVSSV